MWERCLKYRIPNLETVTQYIHVNNLRRRFLGMLIWAQKSIKSILFRTYYLPMFTDLSITWNMLAVNVITCFQFWEQICLDEHWYNFEQPNGRLFYPWIDELFRCRAFRSKLYRARKATSLLHEPYCCDRQCRGCPACGGGKWRHHHHHSSYLCKIALLRMVLDLIKETL